MARSGLVRNASSTRAGRSSAAGACVLWKESGIPSGKYVLTRVTHPSAVMMSTFSRSETGPSSSTFQREARSDVKRS
eukprot:3626009-Pleurochrysis_carterae.AAC.1